MRKLLTILSVGALAALGTSMGAAQEGDRAPVSRNYDLDGFESRSSARITS